MKEATIFLRQADWSDAIWFAIGVFCLYTLCRLLLGYFEAKNEEKLTDTERNRRMMENMSNHANEYN